MKKNSDHIRFLVIGFSISLIIFAVPNSIPPKLSLGINDMVSLYSYYFSRQQVKPVKIVGIKIDDYSLNKIPYRWPWKRSLYAELITMLSDAGAKTIGIDLTFEGKSEDEEDDAMLSAALSKAKDKAVLVYRFDPVKAEPVLPLSLDNADYQQAGFYLGMLNTPVDLDGKRRRLRGYVETKGSVYYSFSVAMAASFLHKSPNDIIASLPLAQDKSFGINYLIKPKDIPVLSFYDVIYSFDSVKREYGDNFLKGALVLVYPEAGIFHDKHPTALGDIPGGFLHLNGLADIATGRFLKESRFWLGVLLLFSLACVFCIVSYTGFLTGMLFTIGAIFVSFWVCILFNLNGIKLDYAAVAAFSLLYFIVGNLYRYAYFMAQLIKIKYTATTDPLRGVFTLRYFYYRLELEFKKMYVGKEYFLIALSFDSLHKETENVSMDSLRDIWKQIRQSIGLKNSFWAAYSPDELLGLAVSAQKKSEELIFSIKNSLEASFKESGLNLRVKAGYCRMGRKYSVKELVYVLFSQLKKDDSQEPVFFKDEQLSGLLKIANTNLKDQGKFLDALDEDIEDKNRHLLTLIEDLQKQHVKTKEAFFQIIASLVNALEARDPYTQGHSERVCKYSLMIASKLNWSKSEMENLRQAALLHDLGKIGIPDAILHKKGGLNDEEYDFIKKHEVIGIKILEPLKDMAEILPWILYHHERWDGKGYPHGLAGNAIPLGAQIISIADVFDALTTGRDYKAAFSYEDSMNEIIKSKGLQFNPQLVDVFISAVKQAQSKNDLQL